MLKAGGGRDKNAGGERERDFSGMVWCGEVG